MLFTTTTQYAALAVALIAGWLFGLASHPGGRKWKDRYTAERNAHAATRKDYETRLADSIARHKELERENARLGKIAPVTAMPAASRAQPATVAPPAYPASTATNRGWFDWKNRTPTLR